MKTICTCKGLCICNWKPVSCPYCNTAPHSKWCTRFGMQDRTVTLTGLKPLDIAFKKLDNEILRRPLKTYSLLLDTFKELS